MLLFLDFLIFLILTSHLYIPNMLRYSYYQIYIAYFEIFILCNHYIYISDFVYRQKKYVFLSSNHFIIILPFFLFSKSHYSY
jgi:hypothetical protein